MPVYEYRCERCGRMFRKLINASAEAPPCPHCASEQVARLISRFAKVRSEEAALEGLADRMEGLDESDPQAMRQMMREMSSEMGEELDEDELEELAETDPADADPE